MNGEMRKWRPAVLLAFVAFAGFWWLPLLVAPLSGLFGLISVALVVGVVWQALLVLWGMSVKFDVMRASVAAFVVFLIYWLLPLLLTPFALPSIVVLILAAAVLLVVWYMVVPRFIATP